MDGSFPPNPQTIPARAGVGLKAQHYAEIIFGLRQKGKPIPTNDLWIAALCRQHSLPLLSRDRHFDQVAGLNRVGW